MFCRSNHRSLATTVLVWTLLGGTLGPSSLTKAADEAALHVVFVIGEKEYQTHKTLPVFAKRQLEPLGFRCSFVHADPEDPNHFPGLEILSEADLLFLSVRRRTLSKEQMTTIRNFLDSGGPLVGIRTASHAFSLRKGDLPAGHVQWPEFDTRVLGCRYQGHYGNKEGTDVTTIRRAEQHAIMTGIENESFHSGGTLYKSLDLGPKTTVLFRGLTTDQGQPIQMPVAWTNSYKKSRIFYTSLGHIGDFEQLAFRRLLVNAIHWCLKKQVPLATSASGRDRYEQGLAGNEQVTKIISNFAGTGKVGDLFGYLMSQTAK